MYIEMPLMKNEYQKVWDTPCPIVKVNEKYYRVYLLDEISSPIDYGELIEVLQDLDSDCVVEFHINTPGGVLDTAIMIMDAVKTTKAKTVGKLSGTVASAGTMIALSLDELVLAPYTSFMIHMYSGAVQGKGNEIKAQQAHIEKVVSNLYKEVYKGFLTPSEIKRVISDIDIWLDTDAVIKRLEKRKSNREGK